MEYQIFTLRDALHGIYRRRLLVVLFFFTTCFVIGAMTVLMPKTYKSEARLFMRLGRENASLDATATLGEHPVVMVPLSREAEINSIVEIIQSKQLYENIVDQIGAERILERDWKPDSEGGTDPPSALSSAIGEVMGTLASWGVLNDLPRREKAVIKLQKKTEIEAFEKSNVLTISFVSHSPELAQEVVQLLIAEYQTQHVNLHRPPRAFEFLEEQTSRIEDELAQARLELEEFKNETGILESNQQRTILIERIAKLQADLLETEAEETAMQTEVQELVNSLSRMSETTTTSQTVGAGNEGADGMRQELYRLEVLREQLASKLTAKHPRLREIDDHVKEAKTILAAAEAGRTESVVGPNKIYQETSVTLEQKRPLLEAARAKSNKLRQQIETFNEALDRFTAQERQFAKLERNVEVLEANYRKYFINLEQARIDSNMMSKEFSNIGVAQPATLNPKPHSPNKLINLMAAVFLGAFGGCGLAVFLEYLYPSLTSEALTGQVTLVSQPVTPESSIESGNEQKTQLDEDSRPPLHEEESLDPQDTQSVNA